MKEQKSVHPAIQGRQQELKFNRAKSQVGHRMGFRPSKDSLVDQHILLGDDPPLLHEKKQKLVRARVSTSLSDRLEHRPAPDSLDLRSRGYVTDSDATSSDATSSVAAMGDGASDSVSSAGEGWPPEAGGMGMMEGDEAMHGGDDGDGRMEGGEEVSRSFDERHTGPLHTYQVGDAYLSSSI